MNENLYRIYRQNLRRNTTVKAYRQMHKLERAFFALPAKAYVRWQHVRHKLKPEQTITAPKGAFFMGENNQENK